MGIIENTYMKGVKIILLIVCSEEYVGKWVTGILKWHEITKQDFKQQSLRAKYCDVLYRIIRNSKGSKSMSYGIKWHLSIV